MTKHSTHGKAWSPRQRLTPSTALLALLLVCLAAPLSAAGDPDVLAPAKGLFRLAFSSSMFSEVKVEDARAAMKVWMATVASERGIPLDPEPRIYSSLAELSRGLQSGLVEGFGATAEECWKLSKEVKFDRLVVSINNGRMSEEYVLLVHRDSGFEGVADLRGRSLLVLQNPRMSLATVWLDTLLIQKGLDPTARFCGGVTSVNKLSQVVLPVFFRKSDACLVTRRGFETMSELNPQVGKQLRALAVSPELVPSAFAFRSDYASPFRDQMLVEMGRLPESPAGQQILTLLQADRIEEKPVSCMAGTFELLANHQRLCSSMDRAKAAGPGASQKEAKPIGLK